MKKYLSVVVLGLMLCGNLFAQTVLTPHLTEQSKKIVVPKDASAFPEIHDGLIAISNYPRILYYSIKDDKYIFGTDFPFTRGNDFYHSAYFSGGAMMVYSPSGMLIIYPDGKYRKMPSTISGASSFVEGYAMITKQVGFTVTRSFIDKNGKEVFPLLTSKQSGFGGDATVHPLREGRRLYYNCELKKYGYADEKGNIIIKPQYDKAENFSEGLAAVMVKEGYTEKWGFIDMTGKQVIPATYKLKPGRFSEGVAAVRVGEDNYNYEMSYIDKTGKRLMETKPWNLNEFHGGYAWVGTGCDKLFVMDKNFEEVRDVTKDFYHNGNGFGVCSFSMLSKRDDSDSSWGFDFPGGTQSLNQGGVAEGDIFAPDGKIVFQCRDANSYTVNLHSITEGGLMFCRLRLNDARLKYPDEATDCFINEKGEVVYYLERGVEGYEGPAPVEIK